MTDKTEPAIGFTSMDAGAPGRRGRTGPATSFAVLAAAALLLSGCSSVPDYANPVEWYNSASDSVGGWFEDEDEAFEEGSAADAGTSPDEEYPNLASVPDRPTPSTTAEEREAIRDGLTADRENARYTDDDSGSARVAPVGFPPPSAGNSSSNQSAASTRTASPPPSAATTESVASAPPAPRESSVPEPTAPASTSATASAASAVTRNTGAARPQSGLWPNRPAPQTAVRTGRTQANVGGGAETNRAVEESLRDGSQRNSLLSPTEQDTHNVRQQSETTLDSAGSPSSSSASRPSERVASVPDRSPPASSSGSSSAVTTDLSALSGGFDAAASGAGGYSSGGFSPGFAPTGPAYLAATVYFGHGSAGLTAQEQRAIGQIAQQALQTGAYVTVIGHASSRTGNMPLPQHDQANLDISAKRAERVARALISAGLPADRIAAQGVADSQPAFYEYMPAGEAGNRRAEILLQY